MNVLTTNDFGARSEFLRSMFIGGCDSISVPFAIDPNCYRWGVNGINKGGVFRTRPGLDLKFVMPPGEIQGLTTFRPSSTGEKIVIFMHEGKVYRSLAPYASYEQIPGLQFYINAKFAYFCSTIQTAERQSDGSIKLIAPRRLLMIQDGGFTKCGTYDGTTGVHLDPTPPSNRTPSGGSMCWIGDRLWVIVGPNVYASDIADPTSFAENSYLAEGQPFKLPDDGIALAATTDQRTLLAFTPTTTTTFLASIRDRDLWKSTQGFQTELFPELGCIAHRSIVVQYGLISWMSSDGIVTLNSAMQQYRDATIGYEDQRMSRSKANLSPVMDVCAGVSYGSFLLMSVPSGDIYNRHTWVLDQQTDPNGRIGQTWNGIWTGFKPYEWAKIKDANQNRVFCAAKVDVEYQGSQNMLFEAFEGQSDCGSPIFCEFESRMEIAAGGKRAKFQYVDLLFVGLDGDVDIEVLWRGTRGDWKSCMRTHVQACHGGFGTEWMGLIQQGTEIQTFQPQTRFLHSQQVTEEALQDSGKIESEDMDIVDRGFSIKVRIRGIGGIVAYNIVSDPDFEPEQGQVEKDDPVETPELIVFADGTSKQFPEGILP